MRPRLKAAENRQGNQTVHTDLVHASMRPRLKAAENDEREAAVGRCPEGFNEAAA